MLIVGQEHHEPMEIDAGAAVYAVTFSADGEYIFTGGRVRVRMWRVEDGKQITTLMEANDVRCLAVSNDGKWIAGGTFFGDVLVWDANTYEQVFAHREDYDIVNGVDFSPDSSRLVSASDNKTAIVWDIATGEQAQTLHHEGWVRTAKYSPQGDRIATATFHSVRVYDGNDGRMLVDIEVGDTSWHNSGLLWFNNHLLVVSDHKIKQFDASTGSAVSEWLVPDTDMDSCIGLPKHGEFIACSTKSTVTFWDMATHTQLGLIQHPQDIRSIALSPDDLFIAICGWDGTIDIQSLSRIGVSTANILTLIILTHGTQSLCLVYSTRSMNQTFGSTPPRSILGSTVNSRTQNHY